MIPASDLTCKIRPGENDIETVMSLLSEWELSLHPGYVQCADGESRIYFCVDPGDLGKRGRYVSYRSPQRTTLYGPFTGRGWKVDMVDCILDLSEIGPGEDMNHMFVEAVLSVLDEIAETSLPLADLFCETRFILPPEDLEEMSVVHHTDDNGETSFGFLGVINAALTMLGSRRLIVSRWGGQDQSEFVGFGVLVDGKLVET